MSPGMGWKYINNPSEQPGFGVPCCGPAIEIYPETTPTPMILQFIFRQMSLPQQINYLHKKGVSLGTRIKNGRKVHMYMVRSLFVEVIYKNDDTNGPGEKVHILRGLKNLNAYLEQEFKTSF